MQTATLIGLTGQDVFRLDAASTRSVLFREVLPAVALPVAAILLVWLNDRHVRAVQRRPYPTAPTYRPY